MADVRTVEDHLKPSDLKAFRGHLQGASIIMLDANLCTEVLQVSKHSLLEGYIGGDLAVSCQVPQRHHLAKTTVQTF